MVLIRPTEDEDPLGLNIDVSKDVSILSWSAIERTEGDARRMDDSYEASVTATQRRGNEETMSVSDVTHASHIIYSIIYSLGETTHATRSHKNSTVYT
jgi:hypothetical protein